MPSGVFDQVSKYAVIIMLAGWKNKLNDFWLR